MYDVYGGIESLSDDFENILLFSYLIGMNLKQIRKIETNIYLGKYIFTLNFIYSHVKPVELTYRLLYALDYALLKVTQKFGEILFEHQRVGIKYKKALPMNTAYSVQSDHRFRRILTTRSVLK
jgi:hypothetical protein